MITKIIGAWYKGQKNMSRERRGQTHIRIMLHHQKIFRERVQKGKEIVRT
jgi:hypothetical protein